LFDSHWHTFRVLDAQVEKSRVFLDQLVNHTTRLKSQPSNSSTDVSNFFKQSQSVQSLEDSVYEADLHFRRMNLVRIILRSAGAGCRDAQGAIHDDTPSVVGQNRDKYLEIAAQLLPPDLRAEALSLKSYNCTSTPAFEAFEDKVRAAFYDYDAKIVKLSEEVQKLQATMRANPQYVGIATNHIRNLEGGRVEIAYKDLPLFPASGTPATELSNHIFSYAAPWLSVKYAALQGNRQVTNLRHEYNDGYAITFAGVPVGAVMANIDESGGVAVIPLPRAAEPSTQPKGESAQGTSVDAGEGQDQDAKKTTTNEGKGQSACAL
jgi:hypothetical protein